MRHYDLGCRPVQPLARPDALQAFSRGICLNADDARMCQEIVYVPVEALLLAVVARQSRR